MQNAPSGPSHVSDAAEERITIEWSSDHRACSARAVDPLTGAAMVLRFHSPEPVGDAIARLRMERAAIEAVTRLIEL